MPAPTENETPAPAASLEKISADIIAPVVRAPSKTPLWWVGGFAVALLLFGIFQVCIFAIFYIGVGLWGIRIPTAWGFAIVNFVWWIGIGHAGTFISAILLLLHQKWRTSINRLTEAMTLFAVACAGLFPILHLGRPWVFFWLLPYPSSLDLWPQFRSPLLWDVFAVSTYFIVSLLFWYLGLIPDIATLRDRAPFRWQRIFYGVLSLGWRGCMKHWRRYQQLYILLAGLATALVVSVHSIVSLDFAVSIVPGWHSSIFPPYFVAGAIYSGFAMVVTLLVPLRYFYGWQQFFTLKHFDNMGKVMLVTGLVVGHGYLMETFTSFYSGDIFEMAMMKKRLWGAFAPLYWTIITCNVTIPQLLWFARVRRNLGLLFAVSIVINIGMWLERYVIVTSSLEKDYVPSAWHNFYGTFWDWATLAGSFGLFLSLMFLFIRILPAISMHESGEQAHEEKEKKKETRMPEIACNETGRPIGLLAEFATPEDAIPVARRLRAFGFDDLDAYGPFPSEELADAIGFHEHLVAPWVLAGGIAGGLSGYTLQYYATVMDYPHNIGGRPADSWPSFIPITFECTILFACLTGVVTLLILNRLPRLAHPVFSTAPFKRATTDRFFISVNAGRPDFSFEKAREILVMGEPPLSISVLHQEDES